MAHVVRRRGAVVPLIALCLVAPSLEATAQTSTTSTTAPSQQQQVQGRLKSLRQQVTEASAEEADLLGKLDDLADAKAKYDAEIAALDAQLGPVQGTLDAAQARYDDLAAVESDAESRLQAAEDGLAGARAALQQEAIAAYTQPRLGRFLSWLLHAPTVRDAQTVGVYMGVALRTQADVVRQYDNARRDVRARRDDVSRTTSAAQAQRDVVAAQRDDLAGKRAAQVALRAQAAQAVAEQRALLAKVLARKQESEEEVAALQRESDALAGSLRSRQSGEGPAPSGHGVLAVPIPGAPVTSTFGPRVHPIYHDVRMHTGVDFGASSGTPIHAAADGVVVSASPLGGYGNATVIDHGNSLATLYGHQSTMLVTAGQHVTRGQVIGRVGCTGLCTGPHLHFEVRRNGTPVNPMPYL